MKKILTLLLVVGLTCGMLAACNAASQPNPSEPQQTQPATTSPTEDTNRKVIEPTLEGAVELLKIRYPGADAPVRSDGDEVRPYKLTIGAASFTLAWTTEDDPQIVQVRHANENICLVDVNTMHTEETTYTLTAVITDKDGNTLSQSWQYILPRYLDAVKIYEPASQLKVGERLPEAVTVTGTVVSIDTPAENGFITVTIAFGDGQILCKNLRTSGADVADIAVGDTIQVKGMIRRVDDGVEFESKCVLMQHTAKV